MGSSPNGSTRNWSRLCSSQPSSRPLLRSNSSSRTLWTRKRRRRSAPRTPQSSDIGRVHESVFGSREADVVETEPLRQGLELRADRGGHVAGEADVSVHG